MNTFSKLQEASYKGLSFLVESDGVSSGKKTVIHSFPNSDKQYIEELGSIPKSFNVKIVIGDRISGNTLEDSISQRKKIEQVLISPGAGIFVHPSYGVIEDVVAIDYTVNSSQAKTGIFDINVNFSITSNIVEQPIEDSDVNSNTTNLKKTAQASIISSATNNMVNPTTIKEKTSIKTKIQNTISSIQGTISKIVNPIQDKLAEFNSTVNAVTYGIDSIITNKETITSSLNSVFTAYSNITALPGEMQDAWNELIELPNKTLDYFLPAKNNPNAITDVPNEYNSDRSTQQRINITKNNHAIDEIIGNISLINRMEIAAYIEDISEENLLSEKDFIEKQFQYFVNYIPDLMDESIYSDFDTRNDLHSLRSVVLNVIDTNISNSWKLTTYNTGLTSLLLECYQNYDSIDNIDTILTLNSDINHINTMEDIKILIE